VAQAAAASVGDAFVHGRRLESLRARCVRLPAAAGRAGARTHAVGVAEGRGCREALVDHAVAVVVEPVAHLGACVGARKLATVGGIPIAIDEAGSAAAHDAAAAGAGRTRVGEGADVAAAAAAARIGRVQIAGVDDAVAVVVDAVAVVVDAVAGLQARAHAADAAQAATGARRLMARAGVGPGPGERPRPQGDGARRSAQGRRDPSRAR